ncbi:MAG: Pr6Pr family membrane protein [Treponema sp.]|jgi:hypothetical protein|nr:Pr6Pr family membrane protein [Treponema sp.]
MIHNRLAALIFRVGSAVFALTGILLHLFMSSDKPNFSLFVYYTLQSNLLALALFVILGCRTAKALLREGWTGKTGYFARFEMVCVIDLLLTLVVYWVMLAPGAFSMAGGYNQSFGNIAVHLVTPLLCLIDYILFTDSNHLKYRDVYLVVLYPLLYLLSSTIMGYSGYVYRISAADGKPERFPYFFFDFDRIGARSFIYIGVLIVFFLLLSHGLYLFDKKVRKPSIL